MTVSKERGMWWERNGSAGRAVVEMVSGMGCEEEMYRAGLGKGFCMLW